MTKNQVFSLKKLFAPPLIYFYFLFSSPKGLSWIVTIKSYLTIFYHGPQKPNYGKHGPNVCESLAYSLPHHDHDDDINKVWFIQTQLIHL